MNKTTEVFESKNSNYSSTSVERALKLAEEALNAMLTHMGMDEDEWTKPTFDQSRKTLAAIREALAEQSMVMILNDPHPPHRLCECTACLEYWTPLPDCDAFAASGKLIAEPVKRQTTYYGYCPICGREGVSRERGINGNDTCVIGHKYASSEAIPAEPVKQEPVAIVVEVDRHGDATVVSGAWQLDGGTHTFYAAPVDAKAIRAEVLKEAAKWFEGNEDDVGYAIATEIRGL